MNGSRVIVPKRQCQLKMWKFLPIPGGQQNRSNGSDHSTAPPRNVIGGQIGKVEGRRDEVGNNVDADRSDRQYIIDKLSWYTRTKSQIITVFSQIDTVKQLYCKSSGLYIRALLYVFCVFYQFILPQTSFHRRLRQLACQYDPSAQSDP